MNFRSPAFTLLALIFGFVSVVQSAEPQAAPWVTYEGEKGPGQGKQVVLISGDEEYRSEEGLPQLAKILATRHGFRCTVLFAVDPQTGEISPNHGKNIPGLAALDNADLLILLTRFRDLPDEQMRHIDAYLKTGKPVIGMRTATHAFNTRTPAWAHYSNGYNGDKKEWQDGFGRLVLGEKWISHHGNHKHESTRGVAASGAEKHPVLRGIAPGAIWGDTDVYGVRLPLPGDSQAIVLGQVLAGMQPDSPPVEGAKNNPMLPVAWTKSYQLPEGKPGRSFTTTMGAATDLKSEGTRRMLVNAAYWLLGLEQQIPATGTDVALVGDYHPTPYGFGGYKKGVRPADLALNSETTNSATAATAKTPIRRPTLELHPGDHISLIGNTLGEQMQHDGWLETAIYSRFPKLDLSIRNLAFSADELTIRQRSAGFGSPDEWLTRTKAGVVFAFFGFNESFAGEQGLAKFKADLEEFVKHTLEQKYDGGKAPQLVLFSPIASEDLHNPNLPDGHAINARLEKYVAVMAEVAAKNGLPFVDLFSATKKLYADSQTPLTLNGIHLTPEGNRKLAEAIDRQLFGSSAGSLDWQKLESLHQAVLDKNFYWYNRYRTTDGYSSYGGRSYLKFVNGQTNREVIMRELEILDVMTANRDKRVWAVAKGGDLKVNDDNTPPFIPVITNKPGAGPNGEHIYLGGEEAISKMSIAKGLHVNLFASEEQFPELISPVQMAWDTKGRLWVATWPNYPHWKPKDEMNDRLLILEDTDGDGKADVCKTFADHLHNPTGFEFWGGGVIVAMAPELLFLKDTDGDDRADTRTRILHGLDTADTHHTSNSFVLGQDGALYFQEGVFHRTQVETPYGPVRNVDACVWRFDPRTWDLQRYASYGFANPHGHVFDRWGQDIIHDGTGANPYHGALISGFVEFPRKHARAPQLYQQRTRPCPATEILSSRHFPPEFQDNLLVGNVIGMQGILRYQVEPEGSSLLGTELEPILSSTDPNFRPVDFEISPDGSLYFTDWQNPVIGHMQHNLRDPSRNRTHGRVYRVTYEGRPLLTPKKVAGEPIETLLDLLKEPENRVRYRVRIELSGRDSKQVIAAAQKWLAAQNPQDKNYELHRLEVLWLHQQHNIVNAELLRDVLASPEYRSRTAATRILGYWRDRIPDALGLLRNLAADKQPRVRLEAVRVASFFTEPEAVEIALIAQQQPTDKYLNYVLTETLQTLEPHWKRAVEQKHEIAFQSPAGKRFYLQQLDLDRLLARPKTPMVCEELLMRPGVLEADRAASVTKLAGVHHKPELDILLAAIQRLDQQTEGTSEAVITDLMRLLTTRNAQELADGRSRVEQLAITARQPVVRQVAFASLIGVDQSVEPAWKLAGRSVKSLRDLLAAVPLISDAALRSSLYPKILPLLDTLPAGLETTTTGASGGRYVRIELPRKGTLTLAEVEVYSDGRNIARNGRATQINTSNGGTAARAIDGNKRGDFGGKGQTHTTENVANPWWEVDLGAEYPLESVAIFNRTEGNLGKRLDGFTLLVLDAQRNVVYRKEAVPAPKTSSRLKLPGAAPESLVRRSAMEALISLRGHEVDVFNKLATFIQKNVDSLSAIQSLQRIPRKFWPEKAATRLLEVLLPNLRATPVTERTLPAALDTMEFADALASLLPLDQARQIRAELRDLGVRVIRIGTLPERMAYDKELVAVAAGKPVEILFENVDLMPHNFVILQPGSLEEVGLLAEATAQQPGALERQYVPKSNRILLASRLIQTRQSQRLSFTAPTEPGVYPYVCTYPGHWRRMYGALYVVKDLDGYLASPEEYLAAHPLPIRDALLKDNRPRTEWKLADLAGSVADLTSGRSFGTGRQMFQVANCVGCHKLNGVGQEMGPDFTKLMPPRTPEDLLKSMLEPSEKIEEKYQSHVFSLVSGKVLTGMILEETPTEIKVIENPLISTKPVVLKKTDIDERQKSTTSIMPKGLLDKLSREEILDLLAYIAAKGDEHSPLFRGGDQHGHHHHHGGQKQAGQARVEPKHDDHKPAAPKSGGGKHDGHKHQH